MEDDVSMSSVNYSVSINNHTHELPAKHVGKAHFYLYDPFTSPELLVDSCRAIEEMVVSDKNHDKVIVTSECKGILLATPLAVKYKVPLVVLRKTKKPYYENMVSTKDTSTVTSGSSSLVLPQECLKFIKGKEVIIIDDVFSTGNTFKSMKSLIDNYEGILKQSYFVLVEGDDYKEESLRYCDSIPITFD